MYSGYTFNETECRFETQETKCQYCQIREANSIDTNFTVTIYKEKDRTDLFIYRSVTYNALKVRVPRCEKCYNDHKHIKRYGRFYCWFSVLAIIALGVSINPICAVISIFVAIMVGVFVFSKFEEKYLDFKGIQSERKGASNVRLIQEFLANGWTLIPPVV